MNSYERVKRWREKNKALTNLRQRQYRKKAKGGDATCRLNSNEKSQTSTQGNAPLTVQSAGGAKNKIEELRELMRRESGKPVETPVAVPTVFRDDYGRVIPETAWKKLQERKAMALEGGYEIDAYSQ